MLYVKCKNPECGGEIKAPFTVRAQAAFGRMVSAEISCPFCRVTTTYAGADYHRTVAAAPPAAVRAGGPESMPRGPSGSGGLPR
jgi:hypothetical protein